jgi:hypothetical protein
VRRSHSEKSAKAFSPISELANDLDRQSGLMINGNQKTGGHAPMEAAHDSTKIIPAEQMTYEYPLAEVCKDRQFEYHG